MAFGIKKAGGISFGVSMYTDQLGRDAKKARGIMGGFVTDTKKRLDGLKSSLLGIGTALTAAFSVTAITSGIRNQFAYIDALHDTAKNLGITTEALSRLGFAAEQSGSSQQSIEKALAKMVRTTRDASLGLETYARVYRKLGLDANVLNQLAPEQQFLAIADAVKRLKGEQNQLVVAQDIFGRSGKELVETLRLGKDGLSGMADEADRLGVTISGVDAAKLAAAADAMNRISRAIQGMGNTAAIKLAPAAELAEMLINAGKTTNPITRTVLDARERRGRHLLLLAAARRRFARRGAGQGVTDSLRSLLSTPSQILSGIRDGAIPQAQRGAFLGELKRAFSNAPKQSNFFGDIFGQLMQTGTARNLMQIGQGMRDSPIAQLQRQLMGANLRASMAGTQSVRRPVGSFNAVESGSLAAYQQRIRGQQQFEKVEVKQLKEAEKHTGLLEMIANGLQGIVAEGSI